MMEKLQESPDPVVTTLRLSPGKHKQLKLAAAARGKSVQRALQEAVDLWLFVSPGSGLGARRSKSPRGILKDTDVFALRRQERRRELERDAKLLKT